MIAFFLVQAVLSDTLVTNAVFAGLSPVYLVFLRRFASTESIVAWLVSRLDHPEVSPYAPAFTKDSEVKNIDGRRLTQIPHSSI